MKTRKKHNRWRKYFPPNGHQYELFDTSVFLFLVGLIGYVVFPPSQSVLDALRGGPLLIVNETVLGVGVTLAAFVGIVLSYSSIHTKIGYTVPRIASAFMALNFLFSICALTLNWIFAFWGNDFLPGGELQATFKTSCIYFLVFAVSARRLSRDDAR